MNCIFLLIMSNLKKHIMFGVVLLVIGIILQITYVLSTLKALSNHPYNPFEEGYRGNIANQYTNTLFFNGDIYGIFIAVVVIGTLLTIDYWQFMIKQDAHILGGGGM